MKCSECERVFEESEIYWQRELIGEYWGMPAYDDIACCPHCSSDEIEEYEESEED